MSRTSVRVFAPASVGNIGPGFDVLGFALEKPGDIVVASRGAIPGLEFALASNNGELPGDAKSNVAGHVASLMLDEFKPSFGVKLTLYKKMPIGSGLGSSAASSAAAALAVNALLSKPLIKRELLRFAVEGERLACGAAHADNAAPSLLGGVCLIRSYDPLEVVSLPFKNSVVWVVGRPHVVLETKKAREVLPRVIPLEMGVNQWGNVSGLTAGLVSGNARLVGRCLEDFVAEPARAHLIPGFFEVKKAALGAGALGFAISGAGPSVLAAALDLRGARRIAQAIRRAFKKSANVKADTYISRINPNGAVIL